MSKAEVALKQEEERIKHYLRPESQKSVLKAAEEVIFSKYGLQVLGDKDSGCAALLKENKARLFVLQHVVHCSLVGHIRCH